MLLALVSLAVAPSSVSIATLLPQMTDFEYLTHRPNPAFTMAQASSYDRASNPGPKQNWFANGDAGQFIRTEERDGRKEDVMADLKGPGAVVRVWSANPHGTIRFYFDGEPKPRIEAKLDDLLNGRAAPFHGPFAYEASQGYDLYFPIPYAKSLLVTAEGTKGLYYHVGYRTYRPGTPVRTYSAEQVANLAQQMVQTAAKLNSPKAGSHSREMRSSIAPGSWLAKTDKAPRGGGEVEQLSVKVPFPLFRMPLRGWTDPAQPHNVLRHLILNISFDGETTVKCPLSDFFSTAPGIHQLHTLPFVVTKDGAMTCNFPMPFRSRVVTSIRNTNPFAIPIAVETQIRPRRYSVDTYTFHAQWSGEHARTRPMRDMTLLNATGEGYYVGCNQMVGNPSAAWWGEGDEKVFVDGESFPSTFGTGSEDFFGYAWGSPLPFERPYHAQPNVQGPANYGYTMDCRYQPFDPIPFTKSIKFNLEMWHWADVVATFTHTAYWYAKPGSSGPVPVDTVLAATLPELTGPAPVKGAIEGEKLKVASRVGGNLQIQEGFADLSSGKQLWWTDVKPGDKLTLKVPVPKAGRYEVVANCCHARDYGIHHLTLNGQNAGTIDFYGTGVEWHKVSLGTFDLPEGESTLVVECAGNNPQAIPSRMFGLDYLLLNPK
ncbi:MAG TPA: DUF2961 domain-containing protein [Fimbriimonas sp.]|nr:DUF2961 domain-containing protein [Fimbriimonas sp.]